jgi:hypothetical protein
MALAFAVEEAASKTVRKVEGDAEEDEFANNRDLPEWKQRCIKYYVACKQEAWTGPCYDCLRYCEGQQEWPFNRCRERKKR